MALKFSVTVNPRIRFIAMLYRLISSPLNILGWCIFGLFYFWILRGLVQVNGADLNIAIYAITFTILYVLLVLFYFYLSSVIQDVRVKKIFNVTENVQECEITKDAIKLKSLKQTMVFERTNIRGCKVYKYGVYFKMRRWGFTVFFQDNRELVLETLRSKDWL
jgi:hypothetical protein